MIKQLLDKVYPRSCWLCSADVPPPASAAANTVLPSDIPASMDICAACHNDLVSIKQACYQCGLPLQATADEQQCGQCLQKPPQFDRVISPFLYQEPLSWLIKEMKFRRKPALCQLLAQLCLPAFTAHQEDSIDAIMPVPLHPKRQFERGFNQSHEIAKLIAEALYIPLVSHYLVRKRATQAQSGLSAEQRRRNVKGVFDLKSPEKFNFKHVVIVDDVISTGSTANEIAQLLKKQGVERVDIWALARADSPHQ